MIVLRRPYDAEQKEFSRLTEAIKSARRTWTSKLTERIKENARELAICNDKALFANPVINPDLEGKLKEIAKDQGMLVHPARIEWEPSNSLVVLKPGELESDKLTKYNPPFVLNDLKKKLKGRMEFISHPLLSGEEKLAHELGHLENSKTKHPISWLNSKIANNESTRKGMRNTVDAQLNDTPDTKTGGWLRTLKRYLAAKSVNHEEKVASRRGIKILKRIGATPEELERSKANLKLDGDTYKPAGRIYWLTSLRNTVQPK